MLVKNEELQISYVDTTSGRVKVTKTLTSLVCGFTNEIVNQAVTHVELTAEGDWFTQEMATELHCFISHPTKENMPIWVNDQK